MSARVCSASRGLPGGRRFSGRRSFPGKRSLSMSKAARRDPSWATQRSSCFPRVHSAARDRRSRRKKGPVKANWAAGDMPRLEGRPPSSTGANSGIGYFTALRNSRAPARRSWCACRATPSAPRRPSPPCASGRRGRASWWSRWTSRISPPCAPSRNSASPPGQVLDILVEQRRRAWPSPSGR